MSEFKFTAAVYKVQTLVDGGIRVSLDLPETDIDTMAKLALCHRVGAVLEITAVPLINKMDQKENGTSKGKNKQSGWQTSEEQGSDRAIESGT